MNYMDRVWANRLEAFDQTWDSVPEERKEPVKAVLVSDVLDATISKETYENITKEKFI